MKLKINTLILFTICLTTIIHQSCTEELDIHLDGSSDIYVIDAMLINPDSIHYVDIYLANGKTIDTNTSVAVELSNDKGELLKFKDSEELFIENIGDFDNDISHYEYESEYWYYKGYPY